MFCFQILVSLREGHDSYLIRNGLHAAVVAAIKAVTSVNSTDLWERTWPEPQWWATAAVLRVGSEERGRVDISVDQRGLYSKLSHSINVKFLKF